MSEVGERLLGFCISYLQSGSKMENRSRSSGNCPVCWFARIEANLMSSSTRGTECKIFD
jgi:hypothetical protein